MASGDRNARMSLEGPVAADEMAKANIELRRENTALRERSRMLEDAADLVADAEWLGGMRSQLIAKRLEAGRLRKQVDELRAQMTTIDEAVDNWKRKRIDDATLIEMVVRTAERK